VHFPSVRALAASAFVVSALAGCHESTVPTNQAGGDRVAPPPTQRETASPSGRYAFVVSTPDNWASLAATGELFSASGGSRTRLWSARLPQQLGPRFVLVSDVGTVVMLDEWIKVKTANAVVILDRENRPVARHSTDAVQAVLGVPMNRIVEMATQGYWMSAPPRFAASADAVLVEAGGKILVINLADGVLSLRG